MYTLAYYHHIYNWNGYYAKYAIGLWEPNNLKLKAGRAKIEQMYPDRIAHFRREFLSHIDKNNKGKGEPDLFLYKETGETLFLEIKKETDTVKQAQLDCLALIKSVLQADVGIVYLREEHQQYTPKTYNLDLEKFKGWVEV